MIFHVFKHFTHFSHLPCFQAFKRKDRSMTIRIFSPICCHFLEFPAILMKNSVFLMIFEAFRTRQAGFTAGHTLSPEHGAAQVQPRAGDPQAVRAADLAGPSGRFRPKFHGSLGRKERESPKRTKTQKITRIQQNSWKSSEVKENDNTWG